MKAPLIHFSITADLPSINEANGKTWNAIDLLNEKGRRLWHEEGDNHGAERNERGTHRNDFPVQLRAERVGQ